MKSVYVGLSGGVDSATSAAILKSQGFAVTGVFIKIWSPEFLECTWRDDRLDAMRAAVHLGIPFKEIDLSSQYRGEVVDRMINDYRNGVTPNPDVLCNEKIKFGPFAKWAFYNGADAIATGHYASIRDALGIKALYRGADRAKDQSYFLYRINQPLDRVIFPLGDMSKASVRDLARSIGLPNAQKPDSQGLCFVGDVPLKDFLSRFMRLEKGNVLNEKGSVIGTHDGAAMYTLGQRHGFSVTSTNTHSHHYVIGIDATQNTITVSPSNNAAKRKIVTVVDTVLFGTPPDEFHCEVQCRYREEPWRALVSVKRDSLLVTFEESRIASPGQSCVLYDGNRIIGGGVIT